MVNVVHNGMIQCNDAVAVTDAASVTLLPANHKRTYAVIYNNGSDTVWVAFGIAAVAGKCLPIPTSSYYLIDQTNLNVVAINGICASGESTSVVVVECQ